MSIKQKSILVPMGIIVAICSLGFTFYIFKVLNKSKNEMRYYSAISWLNAAIRDSLDDYYDTHGYYPTKLTDLEIPFPGDNAKPEMLDQFVYSTDGIYYEIKWERKHGDKSHTYKERALRGKITFFETYVNGQLYSRDEIKNGHIYPFSGVEKTYHNGKLTSETVYKDGEIVSKKK